MQLLLAAFICLGLSGSTWGWRLPYIINGRDAKVGEFPWQALHQPSYCGATLVTKRWLVTAAHCVHGCDGLYSTVILGAHDIKTRVEGDPQTYPVEKVIAHPDFKWENFSTPDIGLIKLAKDATLDGTYVDTITLAAADVEDLAGADCVFTGWGRTKVGSANILQAADTKPLSYSDCEAAVTDMPDGGAGIINSGHICVGAVNVENACYGDSGGPLVCKLANGSQVLAGVMSWGSDDCNPEYPSIYARISTFRKWLSDNSGGEV